jgi:hypothetical protein
MEDQNELDWEQVSNQEPLIIQETFAPIKQANNLLPIGIKLVQLVQLKLLEPIQLIPIYTFPKTSVAYAQHEILKQVTLLFEHVALVAQIWLQIVDNLTYLVTK